MSTILDANRKTQTQSYPPCADPTLPTLPDLIYLPRATPRASTARTVHIAFLFLTIAPKNHHRVRNRNNHHLLLRRQKPLSVYLHWLISTSSAITRRGSFPPEDLNFRLKQRHQVQHLDTMAAPPEKTLRDLNGAWVMVCWFHVLRPLPICATPPHHPPTPCMPTEEQPARMMPHVGRADRAASKLTPCRPALLASALAPVQAEGGVGCLLTRAAGSSAPPDRSLGPPDGTPRLRSRLLFP